MGDLYGKANTLGMLGQLLAQREPASAHTMLQQALSLFQQLGAVREIQQTQEILADLAGTANITLRDAITAWLATERETESLAQLINNICQITVAVIRNDDDHARAQTADDLALLRANALPLEGANAFLGFLQIWLRNDASMTAKQAQLRASLPVGFERALAAMERDINGEKIEVDSNDEASDLTPEQQAAMQAALEAMPAEQRAELAILMKVAPILVAAHQALQHGTTEQRAELAEQISHMAEQAAAGEQAGSPWLNAATALNVVVAMLRGEQPDMTTLTPTYRELLGRL